MLWPVAVWNLGLIRISSEVWPYRAGETHTLPLTLSHPDPILYPHRPYPGNGRFGDFRRGRGGQGGPGVEASGRWGHSRGTNISFSGAPCGSQRPVPNAAHVYSAGDRSEGVAGHGQCCLLKPCQTHGGVGKSAWGKATPSPKTSHWNATACLRFSPAPPQWKNSPRHKPLSSFRGFLRWTKQMQCLNMM